VSQDKKRPPGDDPSKLSKKQLDDFLSSGDDDKDPKDRRIGNTMKMEEVDLPDEIVKTLKLPALDVPTTHSSQLDIKVRPQTEKIVPQGVPGSRAGTRRAPTPAAAPPPPPPPTVLPGAATAEIKPEDNPIANRAIPDTAELAAKNNPFARKKSPNESERGSPNQSARRGPNESARRAPNEAERRPTWRLPVQEDPDEKGKVSTWELPREEIEKARAQAAAMPITTEKIGSGNTTVGVNAGRVEESVQKKAPEPRRLREPGWARFGQISGTDRGAPHGELRPGTRVGPMKLDAVVARGEGFTRYAGTDPDGQPVLVEVASVSPAIDTLAFVKAAQLAARIEDARLVRLVDAGEDRGLLYTVYDGYRWRTAEEQLARLRPKAERAARIVRDAALGLTAAHGAVLAHGSLSAIDVLVDDAGRARVVGLGRPRPLDDPKGTATPLARATTFAAPERDPAEPAPPGDQWALGVLLHSLVALEPPVRGGPFLRDATLACPPALEAIVARAMEEKPERRYSSLAALAADLERFLAGAAIEAAPVPRGARLRRTLARRKAALAGALVALTLSVVGAPLLARPSAAARLAREKAAVVEELLRKNDPVKAEEVWRAANAEAPREPELGRLEARVLEASRQAKERTLAATRSQLAQDLASRAAVALARASELHRAAEDAQKERRLLDPRTGAVRPASWGKVELRRVRAMLDAERAEGEAFGLLVRASALDPAGTATRQLEDLERARLAAATPTREAAELAFLAAAAPGVALPRGRVSIRSTPGGAEVFLERYEERGPFLVPRPFDPDRPDDAALVVGPAKQRTPVSFELPPGSYRARVRLKGYRTARVPFVIGVSGASPADLVPELLEDVPENEGWVAIAGGQVSSPELGVRDVPAFVLTEGELVAPGTSRPLEIASLADALAQQTRGAQLLLPEELERAFRGADWRRYPWGNGFDLGIVVRRDPPELTDAGSNELDLSPFGVRDLAGSLRELCRRGEGYAVAGGSYQGVDPSDFDLHFERVDPEKKLTGVGVRLARPRR
jgi:hypothetical protein